MNESRVELRPNGPPDHSPGMRARSDRFPGYGMPFSAAPQRGARTVGFPFPAMAMRDTFERPVGAHSFMTATQGIACMAGSALGYVLAAPWAALARWLHHLCTNINDIDSSFVIIVVEKLGATTKTSKTTSLTQK